MEKNKIGLIDIGSNTIRLVIFEITKDYNLYELQNIKTRSRLAEYLDENSVMSQEGIDLLISVLDNFSDVSKHYHVNHLIPVATAAIRQSKNSKEIIKQVKKSVGIHIDILTEEQEAFFGGYAVTLSTEIPNGVTVDIGGASTEITYFKNKKIKRSHSFPFGVVTLKKKFFKESNYNNEQSIKKMTQFIKSELLKLDWLIKLNVPVIAIGGSARSIANVHQRQRDYALAGIHGYEMSEKDLMSTLDLFKSLTLSELRDLDGLSQDRADIIIPANIIFLSIFDKVNAPLFVFSNRGLREGIIMEVLNKKTNDNAFMAKNTSTQSIYKLGLSYHAQNDVADHRGHLVSMLYKELCEANVYDYNPYIGRLIQYGSYLYYLGVFVEGSAVSQHTFYIISNSELDGLTHRERVIIALLASYKNKSLFAQYIEPFKDWFDNDFIEFLKELGGLIKFANAMNDSHMKVIKDIQLKRKKDMYYLYLYYNGSIIAEEYQSIRQKKHFQRALKEDVMILFVDKKTMKKTMSGYD